MFASILFNRLYPFQTLFLLLALAFFSCSGGGAEAVNQDGLEIHAIDNSNAVIAIRKDEAGKILEKGIIRKGLKDGIWMTYHNNDQVKTLTSFVGGKKNGTHFEFNERGQIDNKAEYLNEQFHGIVASYRFGRLEQEMTYEHGVLNGPFVIYSDRGKLQRKGSFRNGKQHGTLQYFDDEENVIMEYEYKDGEKISGGIVEQEANSEESQ